MEEVARHRAERARHLVNWLTGKIVVHARDEGAGREVARHLKELLEDLTGETFSAEIRRPRWEPLQSSILLHRLLLREKGREPAIHVYVGEFRDVDRFGGVTYEVLASSMPFGGTLLVHPRLLENGEDVIRSLLAHEIGHLFGMKHEDFHEHGIGVMNPLRPRIDEKTRRYISEFIRRIRASSTERERKKGKPWWKFW